MSNLILPENYTVIDAYALYATTEAKIVVHEHVTEIKDFGLSANEGNINNYPGSSIFYMGDSSQWEEIIKGNTAISEHITVYNSDEWTFVEGIPTVNE